MIQVKYIKVVVEYEKTLKNRVKITNSRTKSNDNKDTSKHHAI